MRQSLQTHLQQLASDRWARRGVRTLLRATWLGLSVWCVGLGVGLVLDWPIRLEWLGAVALSFLAVGGLLLLRPRMRTDDVARRLDRRFRLNEQLATALEVSASGQADGVAARLLEQSQRTVRRVRSEIRRRQRLPWADFLIVLALGLLSLGLMLLFGIGSLNLRAITTELPALTPPESAARQPDEPFAPPDGPGPGESGQAQPGAVGDQEALAALADALRDQSVTRPAAEALDQGDAAGAAQNLRELADQAGDISETTRGDLADALRNAADQVAENNPALAEQLRDNASGLEAGESAAAQALEDLAGTVDQLASGEQPGELPEQPGAAESAAESASDAQGQGEGSGRGSGAGNNPAEQREQALPSERLGVEGVPLELDSAGEGGASGEGDAEEQVAGDGGGFEQGNITPGSDRVEAAEDPLRVPADARDVVQEYFTP